MWAHTLKELDQTIHGKISVTVMFGGESLTLNLPFTLEAAFLLCLQIYYREIQFMKQRADSYHKILPRNHSLAEKQQILPIKNYRYTVSHKFSLKPL